MKARIHQDQHEKLNHYEGLIKMQNTGFEETVI